MTASPDDGSTPTEAVGPPAGAIETEAKFLAPGDFVLPELAGLVEGLGCQFQDQQVLDAHYFDTEDLVLLGQGITLRHRAEPPGCRWTVKLPELAGAGAGAGETADAAPRRMLARREVEFDTQLTAPSPDDIPAGALATVVPFLGPDVPLDLVARLRTVRRRHQLTLGNDPVAELAEDAVEVLEATGTVVERFQEIEVELHPRAPIDGERLARVMAALEAALGAAGAGPADPTPKLVRALGDRARAVVAAAGDPGDSR